MKILAAIPCYNEGLAIESVVLKARRHVDAVLVVDDGSTDDTKEVAHETNTGKGRAVRTALGYAVDHNFEMLVLLDGDGQHNPREIPLLIEPLKNDTADFVIGFRQLKWITLPAWVIVLRIPKAGSGR
jgi:glycosyltransferase involved in cell wall biosynthesis